MSDNNTETFWGLTKAAFTRVLVGLLIVILAVQAYGVYQIAGVVSTNRSLIAHAAQQDEVARLQHDTNVIVYRACKADAQAEVNANLVIKQLRTVIQHQVELANFVGVKDGIVTQDLALLDHLPSFPPLPPCGPRP